MHAFVDDAADLPKARPILHGRVYVCDGPAVAAREACLRQLLGDLTIATTSTRSLILGSTDGQDRRDRETIAKAGKAMPTLKRLSYAQLRVPSIPQTPATLSRRGGHDVM